MKQSILIIGAGAAGLMAADLLVNRGYEVTVVEARDCIGGRIRALNHKFSVAVEEGAEFVHGRQPHTFSLIEQSENTVSLLSGSHFQLWRGDVRTGGFFNEEWDLLMKVLERLDADMDMNTFLQRYFAEERYRRLRERVQAFIEGYDAADMRRASAMALRGEWAESDDAYQYRVDGGYTKLMQHLADKTMANGGRILLSQPVRKVQWSSGAVRLTTEAGQLQAEKVIITLPLGVLQHGSVLFSPPLPAHEKAFARMGFGSVVKIFLEFDTAFWEDRVQSAFNDFAFIFSDAEIPTWWSQRPHEVPLLTGWLGGPSTLQISQDPQVLLDKAISSIRYLLKCPPSEIRPAVRTWHAVNWAADPFTRGAYSYPTTDTGDARAFISTAVEDTLYFAGEAMFNGTAMGTVEAALASGREIANRIING